MCCNIFTKLGLYFVQRYLDVCAYLQWNPLLCHPFISILMLDLSPLFCMIYCNMFMTAWNKVDFRSHSWWTTFRVCRELKQTRTATATPGARKRLFPYFWRLCNSAYSYRGSNFLRFCQSFCCFIVSNYRRATVVVSQNDAPVLTTTQKWSNWSRTWGTTTPRSCQFHMFTCSFCLLQLV